MNFWDFIKQYVNTPKGMLVLTTVFGFLFGRGALHVAMIFYYGYKSDKHLLNHHFEHWKLRKCSKEARRNFKYPDDPYFDLLRLEAKKVEKILDYICIFAFLCAIAIAILI
jgi:hypothetical protein